MAEENWWRTALQDEPEKTITRQKEGSREDSANFDEGLLKLLVVPGRADWLWQLTPVSMDSLTEIPSLGTIEETWERYRGLISAWLTARPPITRLAIGVIADQQVRDKNAAYHLLQMYLPSVQIDPNSTDFLYQINRPKASESLASYRINRLSKWAAMQASFIAVDSSQAPVQRDFHLIRLELDINTLREGQVPMPQDRMMSILEELASNARAVAAQGDIR